MPLFSSIQEWSMKGELILWVLTLHSESDIKTSYYILPVTAWEWQQKLDIILVSKVMSLWHHPSNDIQPYKGLKSISSSGYRLSLQCTCGWKRKTRFVQIQWGSFQNRHSRMKQLFLPLQETVSPCKASPCFLLFSYMTASILASGKKSLSLHLSQIQQLWYHPVVGENGLVDKANNGLI